MLEHLKRWQADLLAIAASFLDVRLILLVGGGGVLTYLADPAAFRVLLFVAPAMLLLVGCGHFFRKVLLPYVDINNYAKEAFTSPIGAGLVVLGAMVLAAAVILAAAYWVK